MEELKVVGTVIEGPFSVTDTRAGAIKLLAFTGGIAALLEKDTHPSFNHLEPGQQICLTYDRSDQPPRVSLYRGEV